MGAANRGSQSSPSIFGCFLWRQKQSVFCDERRRRRKDVKFVAEAYLNLVFGQLAIYVNNSPSEPWHAKYAGEKRRFRNRSEIAVAVLAEDRPIRCQSVGKATAHRPTDSTVAETAPATENVAAIDGSHPIYVPRELVTGVVLREGDTAGCVK